MPVARETVDKLLGRRVHLETTEFHHVVGTLAATRPGQLVLTVQGRELVVAAVAVVSLTEAGPHETEYLK
jgi:hypothetical protein